MRNSPNDTYGFTYVKQIFQSNHFGFYISFWRSCHLNGSSFNNLLSWVKMLGKSISLYVIVLITFTFCQIHLYRNNEQIEANITSLLKLYPNAQQVWSLIRLRVTVKVIPI
jgi:hypothetical protein